MQIHLTKSNESLSDISKQYSVNESIIRNTNEITSQNPTEGEEILIVTPMREYKAQFGDTLDRIALRFDVKKSEILQNNPWIANRNLEPGEVISLRSGGEKYGMSYANGYFYKGCSGEQLSRALPFLTYVTFASASTDGRSITRTMDDKKHVHTVNDAGKISLVRLFDKRANRHLDENSFEGLAEKIIEFALDGGYKGVMLNSCPYSNFAKEFSCFIVKLRKLMIGCDLILITEINENSPIEFSEYADGSVLYYTKVAEKEYASFDDGERRVLSDFACNGESAKTFVDLPSIARYNNEYCTINEALERARKYGYKIDQNENTLLSHFYDRKQGDYYFASLRNIEQILALVNEFGYMGICFDIMRTPLSHFLMYNKMFKTSSYTSVRFQEGCSRGAED